MEIKREPVNSSNLASVGYAPDVYTLEIEFKSGAIYHYFGVEQKLYDEMLKAPSVGSFFSLRIRGQFPELKIN